MIPNPDFTVDDRLAKLAHFASQLGFEIVDIAGFLNSVDQKSAEQLAALKSTRTITENVLRANGSVREALASLHEVTDATLSQVEGSIGFVRESGEKSKHVASWVQELSDRMERVATALEAVEQNNDNIAEIARQVNILAINAKIEAARAGDSGRGFGVVAEAINELSQKTAHAAGGIEENIQTLAESVNKIRGESKDISSDADHIISTASDTDKALNEIAHGVHKTSDATQTMADQAENVRAQMQELVPAFDSIERSTADTARGIHETRHRVNGLIDNSESIYQISVGLGAAAIGDDKKFIDTAREGAQEISELFEKALASGAISTENLFDQTYVPIRGSDPAQVLTRFTEFTDKHLPDIQERLLNTHTNIAFCAAVDRNGYLPTHNKIFSQPQSSDPDWNAAHCRNRRIFDDRVGLKAGQNTEPFLLQVYRRDMGGGEFVLMKDISAPIIVNGQHWGGFRMGVKP